MPVSQIFLPLGAPESPAKPMTFSATRISMWMNCQRKGGWVYIAGYEEAQTDDQGFGVAVHKEAERLKSVPGALPNYMTPEGALAAELMPFVADIEMNVDGGRIEGEFTFQGSRTSWRGAVDISKRGHVRDYKTTSDFKWMKTPEELLYDPQAVLYAYRHLQQYPDLAGVHLMWIYGCKRKPYSARESSVYMTREHAELGFAALESYALEMQAAADAAPPASDPVARHKFVLTLAPNEGHCGAYRGCQHQSRCNLSFFGAPKDKNMSTTTNLLERMKALSAPIAAALGAPAAPPPPPLSPTTGTIPMPSLTPAGADLLTRLAARAAAENAPVATSAIPARPEPSNPPPGPFAALHASAPRGPTGTVIPPGPAVAAPAEAALAPAINPPAKPRGPGRPAGSKNRPKDQSAEAPAAAAPAVHLAPEQLATCPGMQTRYVDAPAAPPAPSAPALSPVGPPAAPPPAPPAPAAPPTPATVAKAIETLFVGCFPVGVPATTIDELLAQARDMIGPAAYYAGFGYKTNGMVSEAVAKLVAAKPPRALVVQDPRLPEAALVLSFLRASAQNVVEALR